MPSTDTDETVAALQTRPGRTVFTDADNPDAWIATSLTVEVKD